MPLCALFLRKARSSCRFAHFSCAKHVPRAVLRIFRIQSLFFVPLCIVMKMSSKGRTELEICLPGQKLRKEADLDVQKYLAPPKPSQKHKKLISETKHQKQIFSSVKKWNVGNCLKHVLAKFEADWSHVWGVNGPSKFEKKIEIASFEALSRSRFFYQFVSFIL